MFQCNYASHEKQARQWLLDNKQTTIEELALMSTHEVEDRINKLYTCFKCETDWLLVKKEDMPKFSGIVTWIER